MQAELPSPVLLEPLSTEVVLVISFVVGSVMVAADVEVVSSVVLASLLDVASLVTVVLGSPLLDVGTAVDAVIAIVVPLLVPSDPPLGASSPAAHARHPAMPSKLEPNRVCMAPMIARHALMLSAVCSACIACAGCGDDGPSGGGTTADTEMTTTSTTTAADGSSSSSSSSSTGAAVEWEVALEVDASVGAFLSVWGVDEDRLYVVGGQESAEPGPTTGAMFRFDGVAWTRVELPADTPKLNWIYGVDDHRFAVGDLGTVLHRVGDDDATPWEVGGCETNLALWGVWGASADDVWTVGGDGFSRPPVLCRFDGAAWSVVELPPLTVVSRALFKVWGASADAVWAVGHRGLIVHFDGTQWIEQTSGTSLDLISLWGTGPDEILAVGGRSDSVLVRWDGASWRAEESFGAFGLNGVWMDQEGAATIVGTMGRIDTVARGSVDAVPDGSPTMLALHAVFGLTSGRRFAVGGSLDLSPPFTGVVVAR
jgi:hypothetical protein